MRELISTVSEELATDRNEAELIVAALLGRPRFELHLMDKIDFGDRAYIRSAVRKMKTGVPIEYLTRKVQFRDHTLSIFPGVFIPRLETEYLVELIQKALRHEPARILEIGTGCGAISVTLAFLYPNSRIVATDISEIAIQNARQNIEDFGLVSRVELVQCDSYDGITGVFDLIVSNPPYIPRARLAELPKSVRDFEPIQALDGGEGGVYFIEKLLRGSNVHLSGHGIMALEIDDESASLLESILKNHGRCSYSFHRDLFDRCRYLFIGAENEES
jgi:release factor glutamine methyltransferase